MTFLERLLFRVISKSNSSFNFDVPCFYYFLVSTKTTGRNTNQTINPQQQLIMKVMPFFLPIISYSLDAALVLYFVVSNVYRIGQQSYITRKLYGSDKEEPVVVLPKTVDLIL